MSMLKPDTVNSIWKNSSSELNQSDHIENILHAEFIHTWKHTCQNSKGVDFSFCLIRSVIINMQLYSKKNTKN